MNKISFLVESTDYSIPLGFEAWIDNQLVTDINWVKNSQTVEFDLSDNEAEHILKLILKNKLPEYTKINDHGEIVSDALLSVNNFVFDDIPITLYKIGSWATYRHSYNTTAETTSDKFYGNLGCNGVVEITFSTPLYVWFLEHM